MTKQDLIAAAASAAGVTKKDARCMTQNRHNYLPSKGDSVTITGFGACIVSERAARSGVNPRNPEQKIQIPAMKLPAFKAGKSFKDAVR